MNFRIPSWYRAAGRVAGGPLRILSSPRSGPWPEPEEETIWIHAASLGETKGLLALVESPGKDLPRALTLTATTRSAVERLRSLGREAFLLPCDEGGTVDRFLSARKVRKAVFLEAEAWPAALQRLSARGIPVAFAGFRSGPESLRRWIRFGRLFPGWTESVQIVWTDRSDSVEEVRRLGFREVRPGTSLKRSGPYPDPGPGTGPDAAVSLHLRDLPVLARMVRARSDRGWLWFPRHPRTAWAFAGFARLLGLTPAPHPSVDSGRVYVSPRLGEVRSLLSGCRSAWISPGHDLSEPFLCGVPDVKTGNPPASVAPPFVDPDPAIREILDWLDWTSSRADQAREGSGLTSPAA